jgi:hypothetical protein
VNLENHFAMPLAKVRMPDYEPICAELSRLFLAKEAAGDEWRYKLRRPTQHGPLFESRFDLFRWPEEPVRRLAGFCHTQLATLLVQITTLEREELEKLKFNYHAWFHITRNGGFQGLHNHQNASWSGIFCVDAGDSPADRPESGLVRFHDPRSFYYLDAGNENLKLPWSHGAFDLTHAAGQLALFPSWAMHEIFPYFGQRPRVVVAFNCWIEYGK